MKLPDGDFCWRDDARIIRLALFCHLLGKLPASGECSYGFNGGSDGSHPTHWIFIVRFYGHPNPRDNGYIAFGWSKARHSKAQASEQITKVVLCLEPEGPLKLESIPTFS